jgi:hypothetical protein
MMPNDRVSVDETAFIDAMGRGSSLMSRGPRTTGKVSMMEIMTTGEITMLIGGIGDGVVHPVYGHSFMRLLLDSE